MKKRLFFLAAFLLLSGCAIDSDDWFVRFWNGNVLSEFTVEEANILEMCAEETHHLPRNTIEERRKANIESLKCEIRYRKN